MKTSERHQRISEIFLAACERDGEARVAYLDQACSGDVALRAQVEALLRRDDESKQFLEPPANRDELRDQVVKGARLVGDSPDAESASGGAPSARHGRWRPARVGHYTVHETLGEGGMGVVFRAEQSKPSRAVAVKVLKPQVVSDGALKRFEHEAQVLARLQHPGIAQIYEAGVTETEWGSLPYFAMEFINGQPLTQYARRHRLRTHEKLELFADVCDAVQYAHQRGVIHRDLKPANVLVDESRRPKVLDFGVARMIDDAGITDVETRFGQLIGTIPYMSPEQVAGDPLAVDVRSDVYSLGVLCYELLTDRMPYSLEGANIPQAARIIGETPPIRLSTVDRMLRGDIEEIVERALRKDPKTRYQSALELASDIRLFLRGEPITSRQFNVVRQLQRAARRMRRAVGVCLLGLVAFGIGGYRWQQSRKGDIATGQMHDALALARDGKWTEADDGYSAATKTNPVDARIWANWASMKKDQYNALHPDDNRLLEEADAYSSHAVRLEPSNIGALNVRGVILKKLGRLEEAVTTYQAAIAADAEMINAAVRDNLGAIHALLGDLTAAEHDLEEAVRIAPRSQPRFCAAWRDLASLQHFRSRTSSLANIEAAISCQSNDVGALLPSAQDSLLIRARIQLSRGPFYNPERASADLAKADVFASEKQPKIKRMRALAALRLQQFDAAIDESQKAAALGDQRAIHHLIQAIARARLGQVDVAQEAVDDAKESWPTELTSAGSFLATADGGLLWFDTADELLDLDREARDALGLPLKERR